MINGGLTAGEGFISAAAHHDLVFAAELAEAAGGDPDSAWEKWAQWESDDFD